MTSTPRLLCRELISSAILGGYLYFYTQEPDYLRCICFVPISIFALSRFILQLMGSLRTDIYCGLTESWMLSFMNFPCLFIMIYLFLADFIIGFRETVSQSVLVGLKVYMVLIYLMYARYYLGFFNLELQFSFLPIILEAVILGFTWEQYSDQQFQIRVLSLTLGALIFQVIVYVILFPKQKKNIVPLIDMPFNAEAQYRNGSQNTKDQSSNKKKSNRKKND